MPRATIFSLSTLTASFQAYELIVQLNIYLSKCFVCCTPHEIYVPVFLTAIICFAFVKTAEKVKNVSTKKVKKWPVLMFNYHASENERKVDLMAIDRNRADQHMLARRWVIN